MALAQPKADLQTTDGLLMAPCDGGQALALTVAVGGTADAEGRTACVAPDVNDPHQTWSRSTVEIDHCVMTVTSDRQPAT